VNSEWSWGAAFSDFALRGEESVYVANGFISVANKAPDGAFQMGTYMTLPGPLRKGQAMVPRSDRFEYFGHMMDYVFLNRGGRFQDATLEAGIDQPWDGRSAVLVDFENRGAQGLLVTEQSGPAHLFRDEVDPAGPLDPSTSSGQAELGAGSGHWIGIKLVGTHCNRDAVGARIKVTQGGRSWYRWATGGRTGFLACSDSRLHVGLPQTGTADLEVRWPDGTVQAISNLKTGTYHDIVQAQ
jgi:hypothetical protein